MLNFCGMRPSSHLRAIPSPFCLIFRHNEPFNITDKYIIGGVLDSVKKIYPQRCNNIIETDPSGTLKEACSGTFRIQSTMPRQVCWNSLLVNFFVTYSMSIKPASPQGPARWAGSVPDGSVLSTAGIS